MKSRNGFTLVEAVVVAAIVAILALVAITLYTGYIQDSRQQTIDNLAQTAAASANAYFRKTGQHPDSAKLNLFLPERNRFTVTIHSTSVPPYVSITDIKCTGCSAGRANY